MGRKGRGRGGNGWREEGIEELDCVKVERIVTAKAWEFSAHMLVLTPTCLSRQEYTSNI